MQLVIRRGQAAVSGMFGGHKGVEFTLSYRLVLTPEEQELVTHYKLESYPLTYKTINDLQVPSETVSSLITGGSQTLSDVLTLVNNENVILNACDDLPPLFDLVRSFGGEEVIDFPRE